MTAEKLLQDLAVATRDAVRMIGANAGGTHEQVHRLWQTFSIALLQDSHRLTEQEVAALKKFLAAFPNRYCAACDATRTLLSDPAAKCKVHEGATNA